MAAGEALSADRPFAGLRPFDYQDRAYFFGREEQSYALYNLLELSHFVAVVGSSGSGKSSLVRAGLLPMLEQEADEAEVRGNGEAAGGRNWRWIQFRPGDAPLNRLAEQLAGLGRSGTADLIEQAALRERLDGMLRRTSFGLGEALSSIEALAGCSLLIVVDQFEELFRYGTTGPARARLQEERDQFVQLLLEATRGRGLDVHVMITMRSDFIGDCAQFYGLPEAVSECQFLVPSLTRPQREEVICRPLGPDRANAFIDPALVEQLLNDVGSELDQLPVLQHCLSRLWEVVGPSRPMPPHRQQRREDYAAVGGITEALSRHADEILASLVGHETAVEQVFRALSEEDNESRAIRRALTYAELRAETGIADAELRLVIDRFRADDCSFLMPSISAEPKLTDETTLDIGHEALLRRWHKISAKAHDTIGEEAEGGWLEAEARTGRDYRTMWRLASDPDAVLPRRLMASWNRRQPTKAWANRYGGHIERVQLLVDRTRAQQRRQSRSRVAVSAIIAVLAIGVVGWIYRDYVHTAEFAKRTADLAAKAQQERTVLFNEMTEVTQKISTDMRFIPGTGRSISKILDELNGFSSKFSQLLNKHYPNGLDDREKRIEDLLALRVDFLRADYGINFGNIGEAIEILNETEAKLDDIPKKKDHRETPSVKLLRADILLHRANAEAVYGALAKAKRDYTDAENIYRELEAPSDRDQTPAAIGASFDGDEAQATLDYYPEKARQRLTQLYQSRIFMDLQYLDDAVAAQHDFSILEQLVGEEQKAHPTQGQDEASDYWRRQMPSRLILLQAELWIAQRNFGDAIRSLAESVEGSSRATNVSGGIDRAYFEYKLGYAQMREGIDVVGAVGNLKKAESEFSSGSDLTIDSDRGFPRLAGYASLLDAHRNRFHR